LRDKELRPTRRETDDKGHMQKGKDLEDSGTNVGQRRQATGPGWAQAGRPSPFQGPVASPFDLDAIRTIYSPGVESHATTHSSSAAKEQRREGDHVGEERVELVDLGFPSRCGNLARKTTSEFLELEARSR
jgi:hypothetical protein